MLPHPLPEKKKKNLVSVMSFGAYMCENPIFGHVSLT